MSERPDEVTLDIHDGTIGQQTSLADALEAADAEKRRWPWEVDDAETGA